MAKTKKARPRKRAVKRANQSPRAKARTASKGTKKKGGRRSGGPTTRRRTKHAANAGKKSRTAQKPKVSHATRLKRSQPRSEKKGTRIRSRTVPIRGVSPTFKRYVRRPGARKARTYAFLRLQFFYAGRRPQEFIIPFVLGTYTRAQIRKLTFADVEEQFADSNLATAELQEVVGFAHALPVSKRRGIPFRKGARKRAKKGHRRVGRGRVRSRNKASKRRRR